MSFIDGRTAEVHSLPRRLCGGGRGSWLADGAVRAGEFTSVRLPRVAPTPALSRKTDGRGAFGDLRTARVALLGCGVVGSAVAKLLIQSRREIAQRCGIDLELTSVLVRDAARDRELAGLDRDLLTDDPHEVFASRPDAVIELLGGLEAPQRLVRAALERGIPVVTANKRLIAHAGAELTAIARTHEVALACEASVGAAVPVLAALRQRAGDRLRSIRAIVNGCCNFVLSTMESSGVSLDAALAQARAHGLAEPDPSADISGIDSAEKLCVLAAAAGLHLAPDQVETRGIIDVRAGDLAAAKRHQFALRLVAELDVLSGGGVCARVGPALVPRRHALAQGRGAENVFIIESEPGGRLVLHGEGAGPEATASAVIGDVLRALQGESTIAPGDQAWAPGDGATTAEPIGPAAPAPAIRRRFMRIEGPAERVTPDLILPRLGALSIEVEHVEFSSGRAEVFTGPIEESAIESMRRSLPRPEFSLFDAVVFE